MQHSDFPVEHYAKLEDHSYIAFHFDETSRLFSYLRDNSKNNHASAAKISENIDIFYTKTIMGLSNAITFDLRSGFPMKYEFMKISADQDLINKKIKQNYSPDRIKENLMSGIDSLTLENFDENVGPLFDENMKSLARYNYYMKLVKNNSYHDISINARIIEDGKPSLIGVDMFGFSLILNAFVGYNLEIYDTPKILRHKKFKKQNYDNAVISKDISEKMRLLFSKESNILFYELSKDGNLLVRKSERTILGPLYSPITIDSQAFSRIDPQNSNLNSIAADSSSFILSIHRDCSTEYYNPDDYESEEKVDRIKMIMNPFIEISHKYIADEKISKKIAEKVPKHNIIEIKEDRVRG